LLGGSASERNYRGSLTENSILSSLGPAGLFPPGSGRVPAKSKRDRSGGGAPTRGVERRVSLALDPSPSDDAASAGFFPAEEAGHSPLAYLALGAAGFEMRGAEMQSETPIPRVLNHALFLSSGIHPVCHPAVGVPLR